MSKPSEISIGALEDEAFKRRERLKSLKRKFEESSKSNEKPSTTIAQQKNVDAESNESDIPKRNAEDVVAIMEEELQVLKEPLEIEDIDITNLAPRKPDWDLKRDVSKKLDFLEKRTQRAIVELIRERLQVDKEPVNLQAVNVLSGGYSSHNNQTTLDQ